MGSPRARPTVPSPPWQPPGRSHRGSDPRPPQASDSPEGNNSPRAGPRLRKSPPPRPPLPAPGPAAPPLSARARPAAAEAAPFPSLRRPAARGDGAGRPPPSSPLSAAITRGRAPARRGGAICSAPALLRDVASLQPPGLSPFPRPVSARFTPAAVGEEGSVTRREARPWP